MNAEIINPFINSTIHVLKTMAQTEPKPLKPYVKTDNRTWGEVTGMIGMAGDSVSGFLMVSFEAPCITAIVSKMLMETFTTIGDEVLDAVGELTNMIAGGTKSELTQLGYKCDMATPLMIHGKNIELKQLSKKMIIAVPFETDVGCFLVEASLAKK